jgi:DNA primase
MMQALAERTGLELASLNQLQVTAPPESATDRRERAQAPLRPASEPRVTAAPAEDTRGEAPRAAAEALETSTLVQSAIALLLHRPDVASLTSPRELAQLEGADIELLRELVDLLHRRPDTNTAMLLGHWYGTPGGALLARLASQERLIPREGIEQQFMDTLLALKQRPERARLAAQVDKLRVINYAELSDLQKQELRELLLRKQELDQQRSARD